MTYTTGSLTSANPAADLYTALASALTTAGFTLVDTVVISTRTHKVWKSAAGSNAHGLDWYLDVAYTTTGAGGMWLGAFEYYDPATHLGYRGPYNDFNGAAGDAIYYARYGASGSALETNWTTITNSICRIPTQTTAFAYWISVTPDRVIAMSSVSPTHVFYCGFFDMYTPWANKIGGLAYPLITCTVNTINTSQGQHNTVGPMPVAPTASGSAYPAALTRKPPDASNPGFSQMWTPAIYDGFFAPQAPAEPSTGIGGPVGYVDTAAPTYLDVARGGLLQIALRFGSFTMVTLGTLSDLAVFGGSSVTRGDTVTISGTDWVLSSRDPSYNRCYGFAAI